MVKKLKQQKPVDIRKSGIQRYSQLQQQNNSFLKGVSSDFLNVVQNNNKGFKSLYDAKDAAPQVVQSSLYNSSNKLGESMFDEDYYTPDSFGHVGDVRAGNQPWYSKIANGIGKMGVLAGTTFLDGTLGLLYGIGQGIYNLTDDDEKTGFLSGLWDNDFSKAMQSINEWSEEVMPNYYSDKELNSPWYENIFTANFIGDKFLKNLGFTIGALYSGGIEAAGIKGLGKLAMKAAIAADKGYKTIKNISNATSMVAQGVGIFTSALNEGRIEALNTATDWEQTQSVKALDEHNTTLQAIKDKYYGTEIYQQLINQENARYDKVLGKIQEDKAKVGNADMLMNLPILTLSNYIQFGRLYGRGFSSAERILRAQTALNGGKLKGTLGALTGATTKKGIATRIALNGLAEGKEEILQQFASDISGKAYEQDVDSFRKAVYDNKANNEQIDWYKAVMDGIDQSWNYGNIGEQGFIGALTGLLGMPGFSKVKTEDGKSKLKVQMNGGIFGEWREGIQAMEAETKAADILNKRANSKEFKNYYNGLVKHRAFENAKNDAALAGDEFEFKNADHNQLISDIVMFDNAGKLDLLEEYVKQQMEGRSQEDLQSIIKNTTQFKSADEIREGLRVKIDTLNKEAEDLDNEYFVYGGQGNSINFNERVFRPELDNSTRNKVSSRLDEINQEIEELTEQISNAKDTYIGPYVDENGNPVSEDEMTHALDREAKTFKDAVEKYRDIKGRIESVAFDRSDEQKAELIWMESVIGNRIERGSSLAEQVKPTISKVIQSLQDTSQSMNILIENTKNEETKKSLLEQKKKFDERINLLQNMEGFSGNALFGILGGQKEGQQELVDMILKMAADEDIVNATEYDEFERSINDIRKLGKDVQKYNDTFKKYKEDASIQEEDNNRTTDTETQRQEDNALVNIINNLNWTGTNEEFNKSLNDNMENINKLGGMKKLKSLLSPEQLAKLDSAKTKIVGESTILNVINNSDISDEGKQALREVLEDAQAETPEEALKALQDAVDDGTIAGKIGQALTDLDPNMREEALEEAIKDVEVKATEVLKDVEEKLPEYIKDYNEAEAARQAPKDEDLTPPKDEDLTPPKDEDVTPPNDEDLQAAVLEEDKKVAPVSDDTAKDIQEANEKAAASVQEVNKTAAGNNYTNRPNISEFFINGQFGQTYIDFLEENPEYIPEGVDAKEYLDYLKKVHKYLMDNGAFDYVSGINKDNKLSKGDELIFTIDPVLGEDIVVIKAKDSKGEYHVVGTMPAAIEFNAKMKFTNNSTKSIETSEKTLGEVQPERKALYDLIISKYKEFKEQSATAQESKEFIGATTKVDALLGGTLPRIKENKSLNEIFNDKVPIIGVQIEGDIVSKNTSTSKKFALGKSIRKDDTNGRVYVAIPTNKGTYLAALCYSTKLKDLGADDEYITKIKEAFKAIVTPKDKTSRVDIKNLKKLFNVPGLHATVSGDNIRFGFIVGNTWKYHMVALDGQHPSDKAIDTFFNRVLQEFPNITTNVDIDKLGNNDYVKFISSYLFTNMGQTHSMNDFFTYKDIKEAKPPKKRTLRRKSTITDNTTTKGVTPQNTTVNEATVENGHIENEDGTSATKAKKRKTVKETQKASNSPKLDSTSKPASTKSEKKGLAKLEQEVSSSTVSTSSDIQDTALPTKRRRGRRRISFNTEKEIEGGKALATNTTNEAPIEVTEEVLNRVTKMFPQLGAHRIVLVDGLIHTIDKNGNPITAYGLFRNGVIYLSKTAPKGTAYHEAFHYVLDTLLSEAELKELFDAGTKLYGTTNLELEEQLAEDFRMYMNDMTMPGLKGAIRRIFAKVKHIIQSITGNESQLDNLFYELYSNKYNNKKEIKKSNFETELLEYRHNKYNKQAEEIKELLDERGISKEDFEELSTEDKETILTCMI